MPTQPISASISRATTSTGTSVSVTRSFLPAFPPPLLLLWVAGFVARFVQVQDTGYLTSFSIDGEYTSDTLLERRGWLMRASAAPLLMGRCPRYLTGDSLAPSSTCLRPWLRPLRLSRMRVSPDHLRRRRRACGRRFNMGD